MVALVRGLPPAAAACNSSREEDEAALGRGFPNPCAGVWPLPPSPNGCPRQLRLSSPNRTPPFNSSRAFASDPSAWHAHPRAAPFLLHFRDAALPPIPDARPLRHDVIGAPWSRLGFRLPNAACAFCPSREPRELVFPSSRRRAQRFPNPSPASLQNKARAGFGSLVTPGARKSFQAEVCVYVGISCLPLCVCVCASQFPFGV